MTKPRAKLTELEGAILGVLQRDPSCTAYRIRRLFLASRSAEWSGSAGAVYPAIRRMQKNGFITERPGQDDRGTQTYLLTRAGKAVFDRWLCDVDRAAGPGLDPFRTRAGLWSTLPRERRRALMTAMATDIAKRRDALLRDLSAEDEGDATMTKLYVDLQDLRLRWIEARFGSL